MENLRNFSPTDVARCFCDDSVVVVKKVESELYSISFETKRFCLLSKVQNLVDSSYNLRADVHFRRLPFCAPISVEIFVDMDNLPF